MNAPVDPIALLDAEDPGLSNVGKFDEVSHVGFITRVLM